MGNASLAKCRTMHCNALHHNAHIALTHYNASSKTCTAIHCAATLYQLNWDVVLMYYTSVMQYTRRHTDVFGSKIAYCKIAPLQNAFKLLQCHLHYCMHPVQLCLHNVYSCVCNPIMLVYSSTIAMLRIMLIWQLMFSIIIQLSFWQRSTLKAFFQGSKFRNDFHWVEKNFPRQLRWEC